MESRSEVSALFMSQRNIRFTDAGRVRVEDEEIQESRFFLHMNKKFAIDDVQDMLVAVMIEDGVTAGRNRWGWRLGWCW